MFWADKHSEKLGGPGHIVEAKIGRRKYNRGRLVKGNWIFGGYERESKKIFIVPVEDRMEQTLLECIKEWILPGTTIMSDCWKSYICLNNEGFQHLTVNHSYNFVDPDTGKIFYNYITINKDILFYNIYFFIYRRSYSTYRTRFREKFGGIFQGTELNPNMSLDICPNSSSNASIAE